MKKEETRGKFKKLKLNKKKVLKKIGNTSCKNESSKEAHQEMQIFLLLFFREDSKKEEIIVMNNLMMKRNEKRMKKQ